jgi:hypothetical protein
MKEGRQRGSFITLGQAAATRVACGIDGEDVRPLTRVRHDPIMTPAGTPDRSEVPRTVIRPALPNSTALTAPRSSCGR